MLEWLCDFGKATKFAYKTLACALKKARWCDEEVDRNATGERERGREKKRRKNKREVAQQPRTSLSFSPLHTRRTHPAHDQSILAFRGRHFACACAPLSGKRVGQQG